MGLGPFILFSYSLSHSYILNLAGASDRLILLEHFAPTLVGGLHSGPAPSCPRNPLVISRTRPISHRVLCLLCYLSADSDCTTLQLVKTTIKKIEGLTYPAGTTCRITRTFRHPERRRLPFQIPSDHLVTGRFLDPMFWFQVGIIYFPPYIGNCAAVGVVV
ncbi:hypothetical protein L210DRAFT_2597784 [Boletus edulis BED1]|uniref:Uncharacterized protein n=1 Tax=Boletus edulis BED1 TaxID=1328754 RepID=A0AAD4BLE3_BOLED|nr:hypothetical protein L210DRAFT_2597784 [Boletus edulis BED1]